jgi:predicted dehydrogenase
MTNIAVIGCGYWGPNFVRVFTNLPESEVRYCCDLNEERLEKMKLLYPHIRTTTSIDEVANDPEVQGVVVATPVTTHHPIARKMLEAGKHCLIEKPMAASGEEAGDLIAVAKEHGVSIMVGHTFLFTAAVNKVKELLDAGELGEIYYVNSTRVNLGIFQEDINVVWDLAPHDISILNFVFGADPLSVSARGHDYIQNGVEDMAFITLEYPGGKMAHLHVSWLDPNKIRKTTFVGSKKMVVYDDIQQLEKIRIFDKGVDRMPHYDTFGEFHLAYRFGDIFIPKLADMEPLKAEAGHFLRTIAGTTEEKATGEEGLSVVRVLEAACESLRSEGSLVRLS